MLGRWPGRILGSGCEKSSESPEHDGDGRRATPRESTFCLSSSDIGRYTLAAMGVNEIGSRSLTSLGLAAGRESYTAMMSATLRFCVGALGNFVLTYGSKLTG